MGAINKKPLSPTQESRPVFLTTPAVKARYSRSKTTLHRWQNDPDMGFPGPIYLNGRRFWRLDQLEAWEQEQAEKGAVR